MRFWAVLAVAAAALVAPGCGSDDPAPPSVERQEETQEDPPKLERGWQPFTNGTAGITLGRPPGWLAEGDGAVTTLLAPDELVSGTISIDRTDDALRGEPDAFAVETAELLGGYEEPLEPSRPKPFRSPYEAAAVRATGTAEGSGVRQRVHVVVLERKGVAVITAVVAANAEEKASRREEKQALEALTTLRTRPPR